MRKKFGGRNGRGRRRLLGIAIAIILALGDGAGGVRLLSIGGVTADTFEAKATRLTGLEVRFAGPNRGATSWPTPSVQLQGIEVRRPGELTRERAPASLRIEVRPRRADAPASFTPRT